MHETTLVNDLTSEGYEGIYWSHVSPTSNVASDLWNFKFSWNIASNKMSIWIDICSKKLEFESDIYE